MTRTRAWCVVRRRDHPSARAAAVQAVRTALSALPRGAPASVEVRGDGDGRIEAHAVEGPGEGA